MKKSELIERLSAGLADLTAAERDMAIEFCSEAIDDRMEDGMSEEDAVASLGNVEELIAAISKDMPKVPTAEKSFFDRMGSYGEVRKVYVKSLNADIRLKIAEDGVARAICEGHPDNEYKIDYENGVLTVKQLSSTQRNIHFGLMRLFQSIDERITVYLPADIKFDADFDTKSGDVEVSRDLSVGKLRITSKSGDVKLLAPMDEVNVASISGDVTISNLKCGDACVLTTSGDVRISGVEAEKTELGATSGDIKVFDSSVDSVTAKSMSGDLKLEGVTVRGKIYAKTMSGDVSARGCNFKTAELTTISGDVNATLRAMNFKCKSISGDVACPDSDPNGGDCVLKTTSGDIRVRLDERN